MKQTVNYNLNVPGENTVVNIDDLNYNTQVIDRELFLKANKSDLPRDLNDLNVAEGWQVPAGDVVRGLQNFKADITYVDDGIKKIKEQIDEEAAKQATLNKGYNRNIADLKRYKADIKYVDEQIKQKVDKEYGKGLSTNDFDDLSKSRVDIIPSMEKELSQKANRQYVDEKDNEILELIKEIEGGEGGLADLAQVKKDVERLDRDKVNKEYGKGLSTNDFDDWSKNQVNKIQNNQGSISDKNKVDNKTTNHTRVISASTNSTAANVRTGVLASVDVENHSNTSAMIACANSKLIDSSTSNYRRNMVMLASDGIEFDSANVNDHKVIGGYKGKLGWTLDSRRGMIEARNDIVLNNKKMSSLSKSSTIVIANYDSHKHSKESADVIIEKGEDASIKINEAIQSLKETGGKVKLMEGEYSVVNSIVILVDNITLSGVGSATKIIGKNLPSGYSYSLIRVGSTTVVSHISNVAIKDMDITLNRVSGEYGGIDLRKADKAIVTNVNVCNMTAQGVQLLNNSSANISNVSCTNNSTSGILVKDKSTANISNVSCTNNSTSGILVKDKSTANISNVSCTNNIKGGIILNTVSQGVLVSNVVLKDNASDTEYINYAQISIGHLSTTESKNIFVTNCKIIDTKKHTRGVDIIGDDHVFINNQFIGDFKEKMADRGTNSVVRDNVGV